jgi:hypothetical protein
MVQISKELDGVDGGVGSPHKAPLSTFHQISQVSLASQSYQTACRSLAIHNVLRIARDRIS